MLKYILPSLLLVALPATAQESVPLPQHRPSVEAASKDAAQEDSKTQTDTQKDNDVTKPQVELAIEKEDAAQHAACLTALASAGAVFEERATVDDGDGCGIDKPLLISKITPDVALDPAGEMRCETALALNNWATKTVLPAAALAFGDANHVTSFHQASAYVCRKRNNAKAGKLSEHARGNAVDISGFTFSDGKRYEIKPRAKDSTLGGAFQRTIVAGGCLHFTTVLGPQSDKAHETHIHLDVIKRRGGYRYCW